MQLIPVIAKLNFQADIFTFSRRFYPKQLTNECMYNRAFLHGSLIYSSIIFCPIDGGVCLIVYGKGKKDGTFDNLVVNLKRHSTAF